jgi:hypothetical protein
MADTASFALVSGVCALLTLGCATLGEDSGQSHPGGAANLPNRGIVPYEVVQFVRGTQPSGWLYPPPLTPDLPAVRDPSAVATPDGVALFAHVTTTDGAGFARADSIGDSGLAFGPFAPLADAQPEGAAAPAVVRDPDTGTWHLLFETPEGLFHTTSADGRAFPGLASPERWLVADADDPDEAGGVGSPSLVIDAGTAHVFYRARAAGDAPATVIRHAARPLAGGDFDARVTVLRPGEDCTDPQGMPFPCWDAERVGDPEVRLARTAAGERLWRMFYAGGRGELDAVGFAAAYAPDATFTPYAFNPVVEDSQRGRTAPSNVMSEAGYLLYFAQPTAKPAVGVAENVAGVPSERF